MNTPKIRFKGFKDDWEQRKFGEIVLRESLARESTIDLPYVEYEDVIAEEGRINKDIRKKEGIKKGIFFDGSQVLYGKLRPYLHNWLNPDFSGVAVGDWWVLKPNNVDKNFIYRLIQTQQFDDIANQSTGSKMPRADWNLVSNTEFAIPTSQVEQTKIGGYFSTLDNLITLHQRKCDETKQLKKFMLQKMFPENGEKNPEIRFEGFTDDWEQRKLGEVCEIKDSARIPNSEWSESGVPYIRASDVTNENTDGVLFISQERYEFYKNRTGAPTKDDVLFNGGGEIGKSLLITDEKPIYVQGGAVLYAQTSKSRELVGQYLKTYFETTNAKSYIDAASAGGTMRHFTLKPSQIMRILMPSVEEQEKIGEYFANLDQLITLHQRKCEKLKELKKFMLQNMFV